METGSRLHIFWKKDHESLSRLSFHEIKLGTVIVSHTVVLMCYHIY